MHLRALLLGNLLLMGPTPEWAGPADSVSAQVEVAGCSGSHPKVLLGLSARSLTLTEMVSQLERGCLALDEVRFRLGQDTIESLSPSQFALVARALGMAQGEYRVSVPPEAAPGAPPDTLQARRRGMRLRDELVHYGASAKRLLEDPGWPTSPLVVKPGAAVPMLVRVTDPDGKQ